MILIISALILASCLIIVTGQVFAAAECSDAPAAGNRIECKEGAASTTDIDINAGDVDIDTTVEGEHGIFAEHRGTGDITVTVEQGMDIDVSGNKTRGIFGSHRGTGDVTVKVKGLTGKNTIDTGGIIHSRAVEGESRGLGNVNITVKDAILKTTGSDTRYNTETARGVSGKILPDLATPPPSNPDGSIPSFSGLYNVDITVGSTQISTVGLGAYGIYGWHEGLSTAHINGAINLTVTDTDVTTTGKFASGIRTRSVYGIGGTLLNLTGGSVTTGGDEASAIYLFGRNSRDGDLISNIENTRLTTKGYQSSVLFSQHGTSANSHTGDIKIDARNVIIASEGTGLKSGYTLSHGIYGYHLGVGDIDIDARGGSITTAGAASYGIAGYQLRSGDILIDTHDGHTITTTGTIGHGIVAYQFDTTDPDRRIEINMGGGSIKVSGAGAQGVRVGAVSSGTAARFASLDPDGYRRQTVTVNGQVTSTAEGVFLANGGRVIIGPQGVINSGSGIAILATGDIPADTTDPNNVIPAIKPKLRVDLNLDGRKVEQALGNNWIINDGGETTIAVNSTVLHEGATGFTGLTAPNGAWNVTMREHGVKVTNRTATDPADWESTMSTNTVKIIADRDFNAQDLTLTEAGVECSDTPAAGNRIECKEDAASTTDIDINAGDVDIDTTVEGKHAIFAEHRGTGDITVKVEQGMDIDVSGDRTRGIFGSHRGTGDVTVKVKGLTGKNTIDTGGIIFSRAVEGESRGLGNVNITVKDAILKTTGSDTRYNTETARGVSGKIFPDLATPPPSNPDSSTPSFSGLYNVDITVGSTQISTVGLGAYGIHGWHEGLSTANINGAINLTVTDTDVTTTGKFASGIRTRSQYGIGGTLLNMTGGSVTTGGDEASAIYLFGRNSRDGDLISNVANASLTTKGYQSSVLFSQHGFGRNNRTGDIKIDARNVIIASEGTGLKSGYTLSHGIYGYHLGVGDIDIDARGGSITTAGAASYGIAGYQLRSGDILIDTHDGHTITTTGTIGHGIVAYQFDTTDPDRRIEINMGGGSIKVSGAGAQGVRVGAVSSGTAARFASLDLDGYRRQTVTVNGQVTSTAEGVFLANGGRVIIGPQGVINSGSGIAILATGDIPADTTDPNNVIPAIKPKLYVNMNLDGRQVADVIGDDWIINDGGETTIAVNSTVLHEGATGFTGLTAPNGAWNVTMREHGVKVTNRTATDPADWESTMSTNTVKIIADRDFNAQDFTETAADCPGNQIGTPPDCMDPPPPMCSGNQIGTPPNCMDPPPPMCSGNQIGTPPNCMDPPPPMCSGNQIGTPPDCMDPPPPMCPPNQIGTPPNCTDPSPPPMCPPNQIGTPPNCTDPPPPPMCPPNQIGTPPNCTDPPPVDTPVDTNQPVMPEPEPPVDTLEPTEPEPVEPETMVPTEPTGPMFTEEYAPRSALYETLPGFLLHMAEQGPLNNHLMSSESPVWMAFSEGSGSVEPSHSLHMAERGPLNNHLMSSESPVWMAISVGSGSVEPSHSTVGAEYDYDRYKMQLGKNLTFGEDLNGWLAVHYTQFDSDVSSPTGGGDINADGAGVAFDLQWRHASGNYLDGRASFTGYDIDLSSDTRGRLKSSVDALGVSLGLETGRRMAVGETLQLTPRTWLSHSSIDIDSFTDAVGARVSFSDQDRLTGGIGALAQTLQHWKGGELTWRGSLDVEHTLSGNDTIADVSGEKLKSEAVSTRVLLGLGSLYRRGNLSISGQVSVDGLGTNDEEYSGQVNIGVHF